MYLVLEHVTSLLERELTLDFIPNVLFFTFFDRIKKYGMQVHPQWLVLRVFKSVVAGTPVLFAVQTFNGYFAGFFKRGGKDRAYSTNEDYCLRRRSR